MDSQFSQNFQIQDPYSIFQVPQQEEESMDLDRSMENLIQFENDFVGPKAISPSFDDNKTYVVIFLTILFTKFQVNYLLHFGSITRLIQLEAKKM